MSDGVITALISGAFSVVVGALTLVGVWINAKKTRTETVAALEKRSELNDQKLADQLAAFQALSAERIDGLRREVEKHNRVVERTYRLEETAAVQTEQIKVINHRLSDLEGSR